MPRNARQKSDNGMYHIMLRGINRQVIFEDDEDCEKYLQCLSDCKKPSQFTLFAYCLMGNHVHLLLQEGVEPLAQIFKRIGARYVFWYNWKYKRNGHLFQDRFKSEAINDDSHFLHVLRYIYQNPVKAGLSKTAHEYRWSSYASIESADALVSHGRVLEMVPLEQLDAFIAESTDEEYLDVHEDKRLTDAEAIQLMKKLFQMNGISAFQQFAKEEQRKGVLALQAEGCSIRQIARITGLSKGMVESRLR